MATFVLVPGFWLGGWAWRDVTYELRRAGHDVYPVTLTGCGEREHLGGPDVNLQTHITDVVNMLRFEDLRDVVLVGHSYAGNVIAGAADRAPERISRLVYVDTWPLPEGVAQFDLFPPEAQRALEEEVATRGDGWRYFLPEWHEFEENELRGLGGRERETIRERATPQPFGSVKSAAGAANPARNALPKTVVWCSLTVDEVNGLIEAYPEVSGTLAEPGWQVMTLPTGHWPMFSRPKDLATLLGSLP
jgi:pimeloyl-ACP methyl ester carboxylesterase